MKLRTVALSFFLLLSAPTLWAEGIALKKVGEARMKVLFWHVYDSTLYTRSGIYHPEIRPVRLELRYQRNIRSADLVERTASEWQQLGIAPTRYAPWLAQIGKAWPDVAPNDTLAIEVDQRNQSTFFFNGKPLATLDDPEFGKNFLAIWLSPSTSQPEHRLALIGEKS